MKVKISFNSIERDFPDVIYIDDEIVYLETNGEKVEIETTFEKRFNTLISLFSCSQTWEEDDCVNAPYNVIVKDEYEKEYSFYNVPNNWNLFIGYISRLIGEVL